MGAERRTGPRMTRATEPAPADGARDHVFVRGLRVQRLIGGESISTSPQPRTVRTLSRFRVLADDGVNVTVRAAQNIREFRKESLKHYTADLTYTLVRAEGGFKIHRKVISLINSDDALAGIGYIL
jgi:3-phenylpropionate/cinnamic acid dioxygenase small subunit